MKIAVLPHDDLENNPGYAKEFNPRQHHESVAVEIHEREWNEFVDVRARMLALLSKFECALLNKRVAELTELEQARQRVAELESRLSISKSPTVTAQSAPSKPADSALSETDYGQGVGRDDRGDQSADDFRDELAELRERTQSKRARR